MMKFFIKDNRIRFFNLALFMVLLSLSITLVKKNSDNFTIDVQSHQITILVLVQIIMASTWVIILSSETIDLLAQWIKPITVNNYFTHTHTFSVKSNIEVVCNQLNFQHHQMVMRC